jgi:hypothetical protein
MAMKCPYQDVKTVYGAQKPSLLNGYRGTFRGSKVTGREAKKSPSPSAEK